MLVLATLVSAGLVSPSSVGLVVTSSLAFLGFAVGVKLSAFEGVSGAFSSFGKVAFSIGGVLLALF